MPVRLGEISGDRQPLGTERIEQVPADVRITVRMERTVRSGDPVVSRMRIPHAKAVMVFCRKRQIFEAALSRGVRP
ncbi:hypothetical protein D3C81_1682750 [compost metagenome]